MADDRVDLDCAAFGLLSVVKYLVTDVEENYSDVQQVV